MALLVVVLLLLGAFLVNVISNGIKATTTEDNAEVICLSFQRLIVGYSSKIPSQNVIDADLASQIVKQFGHGALDGWGRQMEVTTYKSGLDYLVKVQSRGEDGVLGTVDDLIVQESVSVRGDTVGVTVNGR